MAVQIPKGHPLYSRVVELAQEGGLDIAKAVKSKAIVGGQERELRLMAGFPGEWTVEIPEWHPATLNGLIAGHWGKRKRIKSSDAEVLFGHLFRAHVTLAKGKRHLSMTCVLAGRQKVRDDDNCWKSLLDGLTKVGALVDDAPDWISKDPVTFQRGDAPATILMIKDLPSGDSDQENQA